MFRYGFPRRRSAPSVSITARSAFISATIPRKCHVQRVRGRNYYSDCSIPSVDRVVRDAENDNPQNRYVSPIAVFDAFRQARASRDWRKVFFCLTPDGQKNAVFEAFFGCAERGSEEDLATLKTYGLDEATLKDTLKNEYKARHGVYPDDATLLEAIDRQYGADAPGAGAIKNAAESEAAMLARKEAVVRNLVVVHVKDKAGFFEAAAKLSKRSVSPLGDLEWVIVRGDAATGSAKLTYIPTPGESPRIVKTHDKTFRFRKIDGGWLLDSL